MLRLHRSQQEAQRRTLRACTEQQHLFNTRIYEILPRQQFVHFTGSSLSSTTVHSTFTEPRTFPPPSSHHQARLHFSADMALFGFDQDPGQVESFFFFLMKVSKSSALPRTSTIPKSSHCPPARPVVSGTAFRRPASTTPPTDGRGQNGKRLPRRRKGRRPVAPALPITYSVSRQ